MPKLVRMPELQGLILQTVMEPTDELNVDPAYQRLVKPKVVRSILKNFDEIAFGRLLVGKRVYGSKWVADGATRLMVAKEKGLAEVPCLVFRSNGPKHEASIFLQVNGNRTQVKSLEMFKAGMAAREPDTVSINAVVEECGFFIGTGGNCSWNVIAAVSCLRNVYGRGGTQLIRNVLGLIKDVWDGNRDAVCQQTIGGIALFWQRYVELPYFDIELFKKKLRKCQGP